MDGTFHYAKSENGAPVQQQEIYSDVQNKITNSSEDKEGTFYIKAEEVEIKYEQEEIRNTPSCDDERCGGQTTQNRQVYHQPTREYNAEGQKYYCDTCSYEPNHKNLEHHQVQQKNSSKAQTYKCNTCNFEAKYKSRLKSHQLTHKDISKAQMYTCDKYENHLDLKHKDNSKARMYKCDTCSYETKNKHHLTRHKIKHENISETQMYKCNKCSYKSKYKGNLSTHQRKHLDVVELQRHKGNFEAQMYKCDTCNYETKYKSTLVYHQLGHKNMSEVQMYKCDMCKYKTKYKYNLPKHQLVHSYIPKVGTVSSCKDDVKEFESFELKATTIDIEDSTFLYVKSEHETLLDDPELYLEESKAHLRTFLDERRICQLCKQICTNGFTPVKNLESDLPCNLGNPEESLSSTNEYVVCSSCIDSLDTKRPVLKNSSDAQDKITNTPEQNEVSWYIKTEEIEIKCEEHEDEYTSGGDDGSCGAQTSQNQHVAHKTPTVPHRPTQKYSSRIKKCRCNVCGYKTISQSKLERHQLKHKDVTQVKMLKCDSCNFETKYKASLECHRLMMHKNISKDQMYRCDSCKYETKYKHCLNRHQLNHKNVSEVQMYKCNTCSFVTKRKDNLRYHQLMHKNNTEVQMYKCDKCSFKTKNKKILVQHVLQPCHKCTQ